jgi:hypothetical protein
MKKLFAILAVGLVLLFASCGQSAKQLEEKRIADSIRVADSCAIVLAKEQKIADSIAKFKADSLKADSVKKSLKVKKVKKIKK